MSKKTWQITVIGLIAFVLLGIGGMVYYGTVIQPGERLAADKAACFDFAAGVVDARTQALALSQTKPPAAESEIAQKYLDALEQGVDKGFAKASKNSDVSKALADIGIQRLSFDATQGLAAVSDLESTFTAIQAACAAIDPNPSPSATATN